MVGAAGNDYLEPRRGNDTLVGGSGNDRYGFILDAPESIFTNTVIKLATGGTDLLSFSALSQSTPVNVNRWPQVSDTFTIRFSPLDVGVWTHEVRLIINSVTESPYRFAVRGTVTA